MTIRVGIDLSMTSPVMCVHNDEHKLEFKNCAIYSFGTYSRVAKLQGTHGNISIKKQPSWNHDLERFQKVSQWVQAVCKAHGVNKAIIEDYAFSANGKITSIAEMTGIVKMALFQRGIPITLGSIKTIKKQFTNNGNASKGLMYDSFLNKTGVNLADQIGLKPLLTKQKDLDKLVKEPFEFKPIDDIVDAYAVLCSHPDFIEVEL